MGYALAVLFLQFNAQHHWITLPPTLLVHGSDPYLLVKGVFTLGFGFVLYVLLGMVYAALARVTHATPKTPLDLPPPRRRRRPMSVQRLLQPVLLLLAVALGVMSVEWLRGQPWAIFPDSLRIPGPVPDLFFYVLLATFWWFVLQIFGGGMLALLRMGFRQKPEVHDED